MTTTPALPSAVLDLYSGILRAPDDIDAIVELARALAESGRCRPVNVNSADVASSGGPSSLSTLLCPLHLVAAGLTVPKIGVVGRPAGGVDVLGTVPGYRAELSSDEFEHVLSTAHYAHTVAGQTWAPADAILFRLRQEQGTQAIPALAVASLLAKKFAGGVGVAGLEARVAAHGNFGATVSEARKNADLYCEVATKLGLLPVVILTDARVPFQPYLGRGESLTALTLILRGQTQDPWLTSHAALCSKIADIVTRCSRSSKAADGDPSLNAASDAMEENLRAQGSSRADLDQRVELVASHSRTVVHADSDGFVDYRLDRLRALLLATQSGSQPQTGKRSTYPDASGIRLLRAPWQEVRRGEPVLEFRSTAEAETSTLKDLFTIRSTAAANPNEILEVVGP